MWTRAFLCRYANYGTLSIPHIVRPEFTRMFLWVTNNPIFSLLNFGLNAPLYLVAAKLSKIITLKVDAIKELEERQVNQQFQVSNRLK